MSEERIHVLRMLEQGTITYEQALALLDALDGQMPVDAPELESDDGDQGNCEQSAVDQDGAQGQEDERQRSDCEDEGRASDDPPGLKESLDGAYAEVRRAMGQVSDELRGVVPQVAGEVSRALGEASREVNEAMHNVSEELRDALQDVTGSGWRLGWCNLYRFNEEEELVPAAEVQAIALRLSTKNGRVQVAAGSSESIKLVIEKKIQADSREIAEEIAKGAVARQVEQEGERLLLQLTVPEELVGASISFHLIVPRRLASEVSVLTKNGDVLLQDIVGSAAIESKNGRLRVAGGEYQRLDAVSKNGGIKLSTRAKDVSANTKNGTISCLLKPQGRGQLQAESKNGSIVIEVPSCSEQGYAVDASTVHGTTAVELPAFLAERSDRKHKIGQTEAFATKERQLTIRAETKNGSVTVKAL